MSVDLTQVFLSEDIRVLSAGAALHVSFARGESLKTLQYHFLGFNFPVALGPDGASSTLPNIQVSWADWIDSTRLEQVLDRDGYTVTMSSPRNVTRDLTQRKLRIDINVCLYSGPMVVNQWHFAAGSNLQSVRDYTRGYIGTVFEVWGWNGNSASPLNVSAGNWADDKFLESYLEREHYLEPVAQLNSKPSSLQSAAALVYKSAYQGINMSGLGSWAASTSEPEPNQKPSCTYATHIPTNVSFTGIKYACKICDEDLSEEHALDLQQRNQRA